jgi:hypothetical protein
MSIRLGSDELRIASCDLKQSKMVRLPEVQVAPGRKVPPTEELFGQYDPVETSRLWPPYRLYSFDIELSEQPNCFLIALPAIVASGQQFNLGDITMSRVTKTFVRITGPGV